ncbi:trans-3-hydroxy-L-proline dehydratase [Paenibacillus faecis]|uniref:proline racemase family protein n=1 Tax=Paenibacillus faecis TaxID=862114 RepID=UPI001B2185B6|nr:proline racemase family protein [Paenibacillus faecis]GIO84842.1 trans-3-hydroxy-L-proline dehydratase [Paenibacillus faecis]
MDITKWYAAIDTHCCGEPLRIITGGLPPMEGATMRDKSLFFEWHFASARKWLLTEPRGHFGLRGAVVTAPVTKEARFGLLFLHQEGHSSINVPGIISAVTAWLDTGQLDPAEAAKGIRIDCPAGTVRAYAEWEEEELRAVSVDSVPCFVMAEQLMLTVQGVEVKADLAFSGECYAVVDADEIGLDFAGEAALHKIQEWGSLILEAVTNRLNLEHSRLDWGSGMYGVFFYRRENPDSGGRLYRSTAVFAGEQLDRSPGGAGACAHMAVLWSRGLLAQGERVTYIGITGTEVHAMILKETEAYGNKSAVVPRITGSGHILGFMNLVLDPSDPLADGFVIY